MNCGALFYCGGRIPQSAAVLNLVLKVPPLNAIKWVMDPTAHLLQAHLSLKLIQTSRSFMFQSVRMGGPTWCEIHPRKADASAYERIAFVLEFFCVVEKPAPLIGPANPPLPELPPALQPAVTGSFIGGSLNAARCAWAGCFRKYHQLLERGMRRAENEMFNLL
eukprot:361935-Chlamydomonas_euryale.AAC.1